jgi:uncharacterized protein (DUF58 family)
VRPATRLVLLGLALCLLAGAFAVPSLYVPGAGLAAIALLAEGTVRLAVSRAHVALELAHDSVEEGGVATLSVRAERWPFAPGRSELAVAGIWRGLKLSGGGAELRLRPTRRGELLVGPAAVRFGDPFGICMRRQSSEVRPLLVLPRVQAVRRGELEQLLALKRARVPAAAGTGFDGLRQYRPGAPASRIHWLTVARTGTLAERRAEEDVDGLPAMLVLDARTPASEEALDMAVRAAASLCIALARLGGCALLLPGRHDAQSVRADLASWPYLHARLALVAPGAAPVWRAAEHASLVIWIGARALDADREARRVDCSVSPVPRAGGQVLFQVAGCSVQPAAGAGAWAA